LKERKIDTEHDYTRQKLTEIYNQYAGPKGDAPLRVLKLIGDKYRLRIEEEQGARLATARAGVAELRVLVRAGRDPRVRLVRFVRPTNRKNERRPDIEVEYKDGTKEFIEVKALTGVPTHAKVFDRGGRPAASPVTMAHFVENLGHTINKGQISATRPGTLAIHAFRERITPTALEGWRGVLKEVAGKQGYPRGLNRIQITTPGGELIFEPPGWNGRIVSD
jgi:hypothetical protein